tara:strand:+ start:26 stop:898 length:873 start_codon:yes stop_codon:yes gene_type:complete
MENTTHQLEIYPVKNKDTVPYRLKYPIHENLPDLEKNFVMGIIAPRSSGKTTLYTNLIIRPDMFNMENLTGGAFIFSSTIHQDKTAEHLREHFKNSIYPKYDDMVVSDIIKYQNSFADEERPKTLIILDDNVGNKTRYLDFLTTRSRHSNVSLIFSVQAFKHLKKVARANMTDCLVGKTFNMKEWENIYEEVGALYGSRDYFKQMYDYATGVKYSFLYLKLDSNPPRAFKNFTEEITDKFGREKGKENTKKELKEQNDMAQEDKDAEEVNPELVQDKVKRPTNSKYDTIK